jgi:probable F420-dependent oxidoreductase
VTLAGSTKPFRLMIGFRDIVGRQGLMDRARLAESIGFSHACIHDHLVPQLAPIPLFSVLAAETERLRLCPLVFNNDLRHPAVLAQDLATLDLLSDGRLEVGLGAGWNEPEYDAAGLRFDPIGTRIERLTEAIAVIRGLFADTPLTFRGRYYTITDLDGQPKPVQRPHPPFLIGGTRERMLRLAAREGDIVGLDLRQDRASLPDAFPARMDDRVGWVRDEAGDRFAGLELSVLRLLGPIAITSQPLAVARQVAADLGAATGLEIPAEDVLESPYSLIGSVAELERKMRAARERWGINSYLLTWFDEPNVRDLGPLVERLAGS